MVKCLALHLYQKMESYLVLMKELSWVLQMAPLVVLMIVIMIVSFSELDLDNKLVLQLVLLMVLWIYIMMARCREQHLEYHLVHSKGLYLALMKASYSALRMVKCLVLSCRLIELWLDEGTDLGSSDGSFDGSNKGTVLCSSPLIFR